MLQKWNLITRWRLVPYQRHPLLMGVGFLPLSCRFSRYILCNANWVLVGIKVMLWNNLQQEFKLSLTVYRSKKYNWRPKFKLWTWSFVFWFALISLRKAWSHLFHGQPWVNCKGRLANAFRQRVEKLWIRIIFTPLQNWPCVTSCSLQSGWVNIHDGLRANEWVLKTDRLFWDLKVFQSYFYAGLSLRI